MEPDFITYKEFSDQALANDLAGQLHKHHVKYAVEEELRTRTMPTCWAVKINPSDFEKVNQLLRADEAEDVTEVSKDYYLYSFTDDELMEVITKADEWSPFDFVLARKILAGKGKKLTDEDIAALSKKRIAALAVTDPPQTGWIVIGYICAFACGLFGIFIGWYLANFKKTLPNGQQVYEYSERDRKHGKRIFYIGIMVLTLCIVYKIMPVFQDGY